MDNFRDDRLKQIIKTGLDQVKPDAQAENRCLREIHKKNRNEEWNYEI